MIQLPVNLISKFYKVTSKWKQMSCKANAQLRLEEEKWYTIQEDPAWGGVSVFPGTLHGLLDSELTLYSNSGTWNRVSPFTRIRFELVLTFWAEYLLQIVTVELRDALCGSLIAKPLAAGAPECWLPPGGGQREEGEFSTSCHWASRPACSSLSPLPMHAVSQGGCNVWIMPLLTADPWS